LSPIREKLAIVLNTCSVLYKLSDDKTSRRR